MGRRVILMGLGNFLYTTDLTVPIHETMHVIAVYQTGGIVTERTRTSVRFERSSSAAYVYFMGYYGETLLYGALGFLLPVASGMVLALPYYAVGSHDYAQSGPWAGWVQILTVIVILGLHYWRWRWVDLRVGCGAGCSSGAANAADRSAGPKSRSAWRDIRTGSTRHASPSGFARGSNSNSLAGKKASMGNARSRPSRADAVLH